MGGVKYRSLRDIDGLFLIEGLVRGDDLTLLADKGIEISIAQVASVWVRGIGE